MTQKQEKYITALTRSDPIYQDLLEQCIQAEKAYLRLRDSLPEADREILEHYLSLCEELDHRRLTLALHESI